MDGFSLPSLFECRACGLRFVDCEAHVRHQTLCAATPSPAERVERPAAAPRLSKLAARSKRAARPRLSVSRGGS